MARLTARAFSTHYSLEAHFFMVNSNDGIKTEANIDYDMDTWRTLNACDQWPIDLTLQNRFYFVFIAEFVERLPTIFPVNI